MPVPLWPPQGTHRVARAPPVGERVPMESGYTGKRLRSGRVHHVPV